MAFIQFSKVSLAFGDRDILKDASVNLHAGSKAALTGANGAGKSTFIKVMAGLMEADSGERTATKGCRVGYLPQSGLTHAGCTLRDEADKAFAFGYEMQTEIDRLGEELSKNPESKSVAQAQADLITKLDESGWHRRSVAAEQVLMGLGFSREDFDKMTETFSGGWQMRIALAKVLMQNPDILLLDEPTNYLDIEARDWLEKFLQNYKGGFLLVSHDRYFLDVTINEVYELFGGDLKRYSGNYSHYEKVREEEIKTLVAEYEKQQAEIKRLEDLITRFGYKATKATQAQSWQKQLDKIERIQLPEHLKKMRFSFPPAPHAGKVALHLASITKSYDGKKDVLHELSLDVDNGTRLAVVGHNGAGKSTLLRIVAGDDSNFSGEVTLGSGVSVGYFSQDSAEKICGSESILSYMESRAPFELVPKMRDMLGAFLFRGDDVFKSLDVLSGGEKSRVALLELLLRPVNLLVLDEPTNHLDMSAKDVLLGALQDFGGTVIFVSHDRGFIDSLATRVLELSPKGHREFVGGYSYYLERLEAEASGGVAAGGSSFASGKLSASGGQSAGGKSAAGKNSSASGKSSAGVAAPTDSKTAWQDEKKRKAEERKLQKEIERLEAEIEAAEATLSELQNKLAQPEVYSNGDAARAVQAEIKETEQKITGLTEEWESKISAN